MTNVTSDVVFYIYICHIILVKKKFATIPANMAGHLPFINNYLTLIKRLLYIFIIICSLAATSCNSDIFIDKADIPEVSDYTIEGSGGSLTLIISRKGLKHVNMFDEISGNSELTYYGKNGEVLSSDSPASEIESISLVNDLRSFGVGFHGDYLYFTSYYNCTDEDSKATLRLVYDYGERVINFSITQSEPIQLLFASYNTDMEITPDIEKVARRFTFNNKGTTQQSISFQPLSSTPARALIEPKDAWAKNLNLELPLPVYYFDEWMLHSYDCRTESFTWIEYPAMDAGKTVRIDVPANSSVTVVTIVNYAKVVIKGEINARNPVLDYQLSTPFTCTAFYPVSYEIDYQN